MSLISDIGQCFFEMLEKNVSIIAPSTCQMQVFLPLSKPIHLLSNEFVDNFTLLKPQNGCKCWGRFQIYTKLTSFVFPSIMWKFVAQTLRLFCFWTSSFNYLAFVKWNGSLMVFYAFLNHHIYNILVTFWDGLCALYT